MSCLKHKFRIKEPSVFELIYKNGKSFHNRAFVIFFLSEKNYTDLTKNSKNRKIFKNESCLNRINLGFTASKKVGNSVARSKAKRLLRSLILNRCDQLKQGFYILVAKTNTLMVSFETLEKDLLKAFTVLRLLKPNTKQDKNSN